jgi:hypothetical protein
MSLRPRALSLFFFLTVPPPFFRSYPRIEVEFDEESNPNILVVLRPTPAARSSPPAIAK